jgi:hypothetical protein
VSTAEGEKASAGMIAELATNVEETYGLVATRLCRALHSKGLYDNQLIDVIIIFYLLIRFKPSSISISVLHSRIHFCRYANISCSSLGHYGVNKW